MKKLHRRPNRFEGLTMGLDLHKEFIQYSVLDQAGDETDCGRLGSRPEALEKLIDKMTAAHPALQVSLEASGCFVWAFDLLAARLGRNRVHVAAPSKVRVIADSVEKNDANDAYWLAYLQWEGRLPEAFVAEGDLREMRIATRELRSVVDGQSDLKRRLRSHLSQLGLKLPKHAWASAKGRGKIEALVRRVEAEHGERGSAIARLWDRIQRMDQEVEHWRGRVAELSKRFKQVKQLREQIPGLGVQLAATVLSELGDPSRYRRAKSYAKATGLTPSYRESANYRSRGTITRCGSSHVRWALTRAVLACTRCRRGPGVAVKRWLEKAKRRKSTKAAMVAAARKLAEGIWRLFALGEAFDLSRAFGGGSAA